MILESGRIFVRKPRSNFPCPKPRAESKHTARQPGFFEQLDCPQVLVHRMRHCYYELRSIRFTVFLWRLVSIRSHSIAVFLKLLQGAIFAYLFHSQTDLFFFDASTTTNVFYFILKILVYSPWCVSIW
ncbi:hypothetical protein BT96DRAFT_1025325 [Gymnopus androsaceus JB14]|uniref:Uncharacterized protein n=1 Tax=Gymnopus androsaceus JB14 TaxID=1447944 RepID=A0A6A4GSG6_9AGAR|nr:hypothetical protein BT96DRAFT_1025325 [Gymnopus androsaceus JB14]